MNYIIQRTNRKTLCIVIKPDKRIIVKAPLWVSQKQIDEFIKEKSKWIEKHISNLITTPKHQYINEENFLYLGNKITLKLESVTKCSLRENFLIAPIKNNSIEIKKCIIKFYKNNSKNFIFNRLVFFSKKYGLPFNKFSLSSAKTRWGSCSNQNNIRINFKLIMAPIEIIDYVILHELTHTVHKNHSKEFWKYLSFMCPWHKQRKKWLKNFGNLLEL